MKAADQPLHCSSSTVSLWIHFDNEHEETVPPEETHAQIPSVRS